MVPAIERLSQGSHLAPAKPGPGGLLEDNLFVGTISKEKDFRHGVGKEDHRSGGGKTER
jgi:hypothetical protein